MLCQLLVMVSMAILGEKMLPAYVHIYNSKPKYFYSLPTFNETSAHVHSHMRLIVSMYLLGLTNDSFA